MEIHKIAQAFLRSNRYGDYIPPPLTWTFAAASQMIAIAGLCPKSPSLVYTEARLDQALLDFLLLTEAIQSGWWPALIDAELIQKCMHYKRPSTFLAYPIRSLLRAVPTPTPMDSPHTL